jgi:hypothetical protein
VLIESSFGKKLPAAEAPGLDSLVASALAVWGVDLFALGGAVALKASLKRSCIENAADCAGESFSSADVAVTLSAGQSVGSVRPVVPSSWTPGSPYRRLRKRQPTTC